MVLLMLLINNQVPSGYASMGLVVIEVLLKLLKGMRIFHKTIIDGLHYHLPVFSFDIAFASQFIISHHPQLLHSI